MCVYFYLVCLLASPLLDAVENVDLIHVYVCEATDSMQYRPPNAIQEVSNTHHFGSVSDSLGRLAALSLARFGHPITICR